MSSQNPYVDAIELIRAQGLDDQIENHIRRLNDSLSASLQTSKALDAMSSISHVMEDFNRRHDAFRTVLGPIEDLRTSHLLEMTTPLKGIIEGMQIFKEYEARFQLPSVDLSHELLEKLAGTHLSIPSNILERTVSEMQKPWLDMQNITHSFAGFAEIQNIGHALAHFKPFDERLSETLRADLGDWRDKIVWSQSVLDDLELRTEFYADQGFNGDLTDFPSPAFTESLEIAGLLDNPPSLIERYYGPLVPLPAERDEVVVFKRSSKTYEWLFWFETHLRNFIDAVMTETFGQDWPSHRLPNGLYEKWMEKKAKAEEAGSTTYPLICYADFTDYEDVICKRDNWRAVFAVFFARPESVRESLQRLYPPRIATMHARPITQDDELLVYVELKRLLKAFASITDRVRRTGPTPFGHPNNS